MTHEDYLDYHATTPVDPRVRDVMWPYFTEHFGNAASRSHEPGRETSQAVDVARAQVAALIHARPQDLTFTGGATESNNLALKGVMRADRAGRPSRIVTVSTEPLSCKHASRWRGKAAKSCAWRSAQTD
jgi:cysteine desulfurase